MPWQRARDQQLTAAELPAGLDVAAAVDALEGAFAGAFIRVVKTV
jgi:hypothetical protein